MSRTVAYRTERVMVPERVRLVAKWMCEKHGGLKPAADALGVSRDTLDDARTPGGTLRPETLTQLEKKLGLLSNWDSGRRF